LKHHTTDPGVRALHIAEREAKEDWETQMMSLLGSSVLGHNSANHSFHGLVIMRLNEALPLLAGQPNYLPET